MSSYSAYSAISNLLLIFSIKDLSLKMLNLIGFLIIHEKSVIVCESKFCWDYSVIYKLCFVYLDTNSRV